MALHQEKKTHSLANYSFFPAHTLFIVKRTGGKRCEAVQQLALANSSVQPCCCYDWQDSGPDWLLDLDCRKGTLIETFLAMLIKQSSIPRGFIIFVGTLRGRRITFLGRSSGSYTIALLPRGRLRSEKKMKHPFIFAFFVLAVFLLPEIGILWRTDINLGPLLQHLAPLQLVAYNPMWIEHHANPQSAFNKKNPLGNIMNTRDRGKGKLVVCLSNQVLPSWSQSCRHLSVIGVPCVFQRRSLGSAKNWSVMRVSILEPFESRARSISRTLANMDTSCLFTL